MFENCLHSRWSQDAKCVILGLPNLDYTYAKTKHRRYSYCAFRTSHGDPDCSVNPNLLYVQTINMNFWRSSLLLRIYSRDKIETKPHINISNFVH